MIKYLFLTFLIVVNLFAISKDFTDEMKYETNFEKALQKSKDSNKLLMMVLTTKTCAWCKKLEKQVLKREEIDSLVKKDFIPLSVDNDEKNFPNKYETKVVPTIFFIKSDGTIKDKILGYQNRKDFKEILKEVLSK